MTKVKKTIEDMTICQGIKLSKGFYETKENRLLTLIVKGIVVYLLSMGSIGFYLSALDVEYNVLLCHIVIFAMALFSAMLYYRLLVENLGYLIVLVAFGGLVYTFRTYINSGFYAIVNMTVDEAAQYFNIDIQRIYTEQIENRYVTVTFTVLFIGIVLDIFLNVYISRRMQYVTAIFVIMGLNMIPLYLVLEPNGAYAGMVLSGMAMAYVFRSGKHYSPQVSVKRDDIKYKEKGKKKEIAYVYDVKAMMNAGIIALAFVVTVVSVVSVFKPKDSFNVGYKGNKYKELTMAAVSTILMDGWYGFFRMSSDVGGLQGGELGAVSTVRLDYQTDLVVHMAPYTYDRIYLKGFTGVMYNPYENCWTSVEHLSDFDEDMAPEANSLRDSHLEGHEASAEATMMIDNVETDRLYLPYYTYSCTDYNRFTAALFYPRLEGNNTFVDLSYYGGQGYTEADLYVPEENLEAVAQISEELGVVITDEDVINALIDYYQENIPYTIRPGRTPYRKDFVNDFLLDKKKGYCSHYASAAVLIFRYMGIPARYIEGYAIDYTQLYNAEIAEGVVYEDYYTGYSEIGETAVIRVNVTDADAHAWVEVYDVEKGWYPVEVTPTATAEEEYEDFWDMFTRMTENTGDNSDDVVNAIDVNNTMNKIIKNAVYGLVILAVIAVALLLVLKLGVWLKYIIVFLSADINDKLIFKYQSLCRKKRRKDKEFRGKLNYREQLEYLISKQGEVLDEDIRKSCEETISILEKAGFSQDSITEDDYHQVIMWLKKYV